MLHFKKNVIKLYIVLLINLLLATFSITQNKGVLVYISGTDINAVHYLFYLFYFIFAKYATYNQPG